ncbi:zinc-binding alcohol dehydrogenase [Halogeometricum sp. S1BR25-6]|uniref:Zinc-binding alcohol dehydrogenase n=1 Tax=Halogeometricum salsisoli TaxID=2950536 RepID=A0ABU2G949_9EURY|nr:zinc-binding alcohol dehydrogenase [Halogeometricum sp. S1BR25-6]MDS0297342.1 zinc-binding alcohol dehydrogenase [Halogeometricum sp. S1BR25-6]
MTDARRVRFTEPRTVDVEHGPVPRPDDGEVLVETTVSAVSPGTELLVYRDDVPTDVPLDATIDGFDEPLSYPVSYGYAAVGVVVAVGDAVDAAWAGRRVFAFRPHASHFCAAPDSLVALPDDVSDEDAAMLATAETATGFVMDGRPRVGERVAVFGQGVVGLLTTALLARFPLSDLVTVDRHASRRTRSRSLGAHEAFTPEAVQDSVTDRFPGDGRADLAFELSGNPEALSDAISLTGDDGRLVVGSWYGSKPVSLDLGGRFHRSRMRVRSSQVSEIDADHAGRWDKKRRLDYVLDSLPDLEPSSLVTHRFPVEDAADAYRVLDRDPADAVQVLFTY